MFLSVQKEFVQPYNKIKDIFYNSWLTFSGTEHADCFDLPRFGDFCCNPVQWR